MVKSKPVSFLAIAIAFFSYILLTLLAFSQFPGRYSPLNNWLSDLGSSDLNPKGAIFYNSGIIVTGLLLLLFFWGLSRWKLKGNRIQNAMLLVTQIFGFLGCLAMVMSALYPINQIEQHRFWSISLYILLGTGFMFSVAAFRYFPRFPRWVLALGVATGLIDITSSFFNTATIIEWITVVLFLGYALIVGILSREDKN